MYVVLNSSHGMSIFVSQAYKSKFSAVVVDDIERLIDYNEIGYRYTTCV